MNKKNVKLKNVGECFAFDKGDMLKGGELTHKMAAKLNRTANNTSTLWRGSQYKQFYHISNLGELLNSDMIIKPWLRPVDGSGIIRTIFSLCPEGITHAIEAGVILPELTHNLPGFDLAIDSFKLLPNGTDEEWTYDDILNKLTDFVYDIGDDNENAMDSYGEYTFDYFSSAITLIDTENCWPEDIVSLLHLNIVRVARLMYLQRLITDFGETVEWGPKYDLIDMMYRLVSHKMVGGIHYPAMDKAAKWIKNVTKECQICKVIKPIPECPTVKYDHPWNDSCWVLDGENMSSKTFKAGLDIMEAYRKELYGEGTK